MLRFKQFLAEILNSQIKFDKITRNGDLYIFHKYIDSQRMIIEIEIEEDTIVISFGFAGSNNYEYGIDYALKGNRDNTFKTVNYIKNAIKTVIRENKMHKGSILFVAIEKEKNKAYSFFASQMAKELNGRVTFNKFGAYRVEF